MSAESRCAILGHLGSGWRRSSPVFSPCPGTHPLLTETWCDQCWARMVACDGGRAVLGASLGGRMTGGAGLEPPAQSELVFEVRNLARVETAGSAAQAFSRECVDLKWQHHGLP